MYPSARRHPLKTTHRVPDSETLAAILAVAHHKGMNQAAESLGVSQQSVSSRVAKYEKQLGIRLFHRDAQGSHLTEKGEEVVGSLKKLHQAMTDCGAQLDAIAGRTRMEPLSIAVSHTVAEFDYPRWLARFREFAPGVAVTMAQLNSSDAQKSVVEGENELAIVEGTSVLRELKEKTVAHDELVLAVPSGHPWVTKQDEAERAARGAGNSHGCGSEKGGQNRKNTHWRLTKEELAATPLVLREAGSGTREVVENALGQLAPPAGEFGSLASQRAAIGALGQPGIISRRAIDYQLRTGEYVEIAVDDLHLSRAIRVLWSGHNKLSESARCFIRVLDDDSRRE